jgi:REP-associated tyrosine transposase
MAIPKRNTRSPGTYFITSRTWESRALFVQGAVCEIFTECLLDYRDRGVYLLHAFVLMPEHFHILLTPNASLERAVMYIKGGSARRIRQGLGFKFPVWQRGFSDHRIRDAEDYDIRLRYLEKNPVKRQLTTSTAEYLWSSASRRFELDDPPQGLKPPARRMSIGTA